FDAEQIIAAAVEALWVEAAEVAHARQRDVDQPVEKLVHARLAQGNLAADRLTVAQLVGRDRLARLGDHRLLAGDEREIGGGRVDLLAVGDAFADAHVDHDLVEHGDLHAVLVAELLGELAADLLVELDPQPRGNARLRLARDLFAGSLFAAGLRAFVALAGLSRLRRLVGLFALGGLRRLLGFRARLSRLLGFLVFLISHRSLLPNAWRPAPSCDRRLDL